MPDLIKTSLGVFTAPGTGFEIQGQAGSHQASVTVQGAAAVSASVTIRGSNDKLAWDVIGSASPSGTGAATASVSWTKDYLFWRADVASMTGERVVVNVASDQAGGGSTVSAGGGGNSLFPAVDPSIGLTKCAKLEMVTSSTSFTLLDTTGTNKPGTVSAIYLVSPTPSLLRDGVLQVFVDGEATPSVSVEMHNMGTYLIEPNQNFWTSRVQLQTADPDTNPSTPKAQMLVLKYPIFYKVSVRIVLLTKPGTASTLFSNVVYHEGYTLPWKLKTSSIGYGNRLIAQGKAEFENRNIRMLQRPAGQSGLIAAVSVTFPNIQPQALENNIVVYSASQALDGTADPLFNTSGGEDFFGDFYYFANEYKAVSPWKYVITQANRDITQNASYTRLSMMMDFLDHHGGITYQDGAVLTFEKGKAATPGDMETRTVDLFYSVWYYEPY